MFSSATIRISQENRQINHQLLLTSLLSSFTERKDGRDKGWVLQPSVLLMIPDGRDKEWALQSSVLLMNPDGRNEHGYVASTLRLYKLITQIMFFDMR